MRGNMHGVSFLSGLISFDGDVDRKIIIQDNYSAGGYQVVYYAMVRYVIDCHE